MKTRSRIEITAFRRRTTIILRDKPEDVPALPPRHDVSSHSVIADSSPVEAVDLGPQGHAAFAGHLEIPDYQKETDMREQVGQPSKNQRYDRFG